jgi:superfamily I DNA/RNA helicase
MDRSVATAPDLAALATHTGGPLLVEGPAGSGKTWLLLKRCEWLVERGTMPDRWCCCPACARADAARARPEERLTDGYRELVVSTQAQLAATILPRMGSRLELLDQVL